MSLIVRNISGSPLPINDLGITLGTGDTLNLALEFSPQDIASSANGGDLDAAISSNNAVIVDPLDDATDLSTAESLEIARAANDANYRIRGFTFEDEGSLISGGPHRTIDFTGAGVTVSDTGGGEISVSIPGGGSGVTLEDEGITVSGGPHDILNFVGDAVTVTDAGSGEATITITADTADFCIDFFTSDLSQTELKLVDKSLHFTLPSFAAVPSPYEPSSRNIHQLVHTINDELRFFKSDGTQDNIPVSACT